MSRKSKKVRPTPVNPTAVAAIEGVLDAIEKGVSREVPSLAKSAPALRAVFGMLLGSALGEKGGTLTIEGQEPITVSKTDAMAVAFNSLSDLTRLEVEDAATKAIKKYKPR